MAAPTDRTAFVAFLAHEKLAAVWLIASEKNVAGRSLGAGFGGRRFYARMAHRVGGEGDRVTKLHARAPGASSEKLNAAFQRYEIGLQHRSRSAPKLALAGSTAELRDTANTEP